MTKTILIVDDKKSTQRMVAEYLNENGFRTVTASNGREALLVARHERPDLILLDVMMPEMDGFEFIRHHRKERGTPVIMITARVEEQDKIIGLELGADDYVTKPFSLAELVARIRAVMRRAAEQASSTADALLRAGDITMDRQTRQVMVGARRIDLTPSEFAILGVLMAAPGQVFSRIDLLERIKGNVFENVERTVDVHIRNLRAKLEDDPAAPQYILTVFGVGYRFNPDHDTING